jgi:hypothetical protein
LFTQTTPALTRVATRNARSRSDDQTDAQAELRVVGTCDRVVDVRTAQDGQHRAELLLAHPPWHYRDVADDGRLDEIALPLEHPAAGDDGAVLSRVLKEPFTFSNCAWFWIEPICVPGSSLSPTTVARARRPNSQTTS